MRDDHSVLLWQICAYADELTDAMHGGLLSGNSYDELVEFLHDKLLPYLSAEEGCLPPGQLRDRHLMKLIGNEHARLRADVDNIEGSKTLDLLALATETLVDRLERHVHREEAWLTSADEFSIKRQGVSEPIPRGSAWV